MKLIGFMTTSRLTIVDVSQLLHDDEHELAHFFTVPSK